MKKLLGLLSILQDLCQMRNKILNHDQVRWFCDSFHKVIIIYDQKENRDHPGPGTAATGMPVYNF